MTRTKNRILSSDEIASFVGWTFDDVDQAAVRFASKLREQEQAQDRLREDEARQAGYVQGFEEGRALGLREGAQQLDAYVAGKGREVTRHFGALFQSASEQIDQAQQVMAESVLRLACEIARHVIRRELEVQADSVRPVVREALELLSSDARVAVVRLNPLDLEVMQSSWEQEHSGLALNLKGDASITPGGCLVEAAGTVVDGTIERRWMRAAARLGLESSWSADNATA